MYKDVSNVGAMPPTDGNTGEDLVLVSKKELETLQRERDEYRAMCLDFAESVPRVHKIADNIEAILNAGGVSG